MKYSYIKDVKIIKTIILLHKRGGLISSMRYPNFFSKKLFYFLTHCVNITTVPLKWTNRSLN